MVGWMFNRSNPAGNMGGQPLPHHIAAAPLVGYRSWLIVNDGQGLAFKSLHLPHVWETEETASCYPVGLMYPNPVPGHGNTSPDVHCACGLYAALPDHPIEEWEHMRRARVSASGSILMWGKIIQCERGFKAEHARIQSPVVLEISCRLGCDTEPERVELAAPHAPYWSYCPTDANEHAETVTVDAGVWLKEAARELSDRYRLEVLTWEML